MSHISVKSELMENKEDAYKYYKNNMINLDKSIRKIEKERDEPYKEIIIPVRIKSDHKDDWVKNLKIAIQVNTISQTKQIIEVKITDNTDPLVLYSVEIGEQEFHSIKHEQTLLIDFQQFPQNIYDMLDYCIERMDDNMSNRSSMSTYGCILHQITLNDAHLIIQESTQFRQLVHLKLKLKSASDGRLKDYLSDLVKEFKLKSENYYEENNKLKENLEKNLAQQKNLKEELMFINEKQY